MKDTKIPAGLEQHLAEVKTAMKPKGKNELIKIIGALLVDNYLLKEAVGNTPANLKARRRQGWKMFGLGFIAALFMLGFAAAANADQLKLDTKNTVVFRGEVTSETVTKAQLALAAAVKSRVMGSKIYLVLDTPGGDITAGESFIAYARQIKSLETVSMFAASMGSAIVEALPGKRHIVAGGTLMFHRAAISLQGYVETGEVESQLAYFKEMILGMETRNANRLGLAITDYKIKVKDEWWMYGANAVQHKAADIVSSISCSQELIDARDVIVMQNLFGAITLTFSRCPLFQYPVAIK